MFSDQIHLSSDARNSRRLAGAADKVDEVVGALRHNARVLSEDACEGDAPLVAQIQTGLRQGADELELRSLYLRNPPWNFVRADSQEGARLFLETATSRPFNEQDELTQHLLQTHQEALQSCAAGNGCAEGLKADNQRYRDTPLDEGAGEGYHRSTNCARMRARAARTPYLKQSTRLKQNIRQFKQFLKKGAAGRRVLRYEWRHWQRLVQTNPRRIWYRKKMRPRAIFERMYRMDAASLEDWSLVCRPILAPGSGPPPKALVLPDAPTTTLAQLRVEYLSALLRNHHWFQVQVPAAGMDEAGAPLERMETKIFQVLSTASARSRPKLMPTISSHSHPVNVARLAICIQEVSQREVEGLDAGSVVVHADNDSRWIPWGELGPWAHVQGSLTHFGSSQGATGHAGCLMLSNPEAARSPYALTDFRCPTLAILSALHRIGWRPVADTVVHATTAVGHMDSREAVSMKAYFIVLLDFDGCLRHCPTGIPSDQPIAFYRLLLKGVSVLPDLGNAHYLALQRGLDDPAPVAIGDASDSEDPSLSKIMPMFCYLTSCFGIRVFMYDTRFVLILC